MAVVTVAIVLVMVLVLAVCSVILQTPPLPLTFFVPYNSFLLISTL